MACPPSPIPFSSKSSGGDGNDQLSLDEANGALPKANLFGEAGNDILTGGSGDDVLNGGPGSDTLLGKGGADSLLGGDGDDIVNGGDGDDIAQLGLGTTASSGIRGDDTDVIEGGDGVDTIEVNGGNGAEVVHHDRERHPRAFRSGESRSVLPRHRHLRKTCGQCQRRR